MQYYSFVRIFALTLLSTPVFARHIVTPTIDSPAVHCPTDAHVNVDIVDNKHGGQQNISIARNAPIPVPMYAGHIVENEMKSNMKLRILCVGDSVTVGTGSSVLNGYKKRLRSDLIGKCRMADLLLCSF